MFNYKNNTLTYSQLKENFSTINDIPFFLSEADYNFLSFRVSLYIKNEEIKLKNIQSSNLELKSSRKRIELYKASKLKVLNRLKSTLKNFFIELNQERLPQSDFNPYLELFFKDWLWDQEDNLSYIDQIPTDSENILFLGCGAARMAYEYAKKNPSIDVYATDINPINLTLLFNQNKTKLFDVVKHPKELDKTSNKFEFSSPDKLENFYPFVSDFYTMDLQKFDHIVSNWFLDILPNDINTNLSHALSFLNDGGQFTYIGLANFYNKTLEESFTQDEILETFQNYFAHIKHSTQNFNYLNTEYVSQKRQEQLLIINAKEHESQKAKRFQSSQIKLRFNQDVANKKMEFQTYGNFLKHIDSDLSLEACASILEKEFGFSNNEAINYAKLMISKINS